MSEQTLEQRDLQPVSDVDHVQLARLVTEISWRIDHGRAGTVHELFAPDGTLALGPDQELAGREAIREWGLRIEEAGWRIRHVTSNARFLADGEDAACGVTLVTAYMNERDELGSTVPWAVGEDHDRFLRTPEGWRVLSRRWEELFLRTESASPRTDR